MTATRFFIFREASTATVGKLVYRAYKEENMTGYICTEDSQGACRERATFMLDNEPLLVEIVEKGHG
jgi:hypothetical protein